MGSWLAGQGEDSVKLRSRAKCDQLQALDQFSVFKISSADFKHWNDRIQYLITTKNRLCLHAEISMLEHERW